MARLLGRGRGGALLSYVDELRRELAAVGIRGSLRRRILTEVADHLREDPQADLGAPSVLASQFADELATDATRRAAYACFAALALAGTVFSYAVLSVGRVGGAPDVFGGNDPAIGLLAALGLIVLPQISFVAGSLGLLRMLRRRSTLLAAAETRVVLRRVGVGLAAGAGSMLCLGTYAVEHQRDLSRLWTDTTVAGTAAAGTAVLAAAFVSLRAARLRPQVAGEAGDVFDDLALPRIDPWRFAVRVALLAGALVWIAGIAQGDPIDGFVRGCAETVACLAGFGALGRYLGLRR